MVKIAAEQMGLEPTTKMVVDINDADPTKGIDAAKAMLEKENLPINDENIFIAASCKEKGILYLLGKAQPNGIRKVDHEAEAAKKSGDHCHRQRKATEQAEQHQGYRQRKRVSP